VARRGEHDGGSGFAGDVAAGELRHARAVAAAVLCFPFTYMRARLTDGPHLSVTELEKIVQKFQFLVPFCKFCNSYLVDPN